MTEAPPRPAARAVLATPPLDAPVVDDEAALALYAALAAEEARVLIERLEAHHPYSALHSKRVAWLAERTSSRMELPVAERRFLYNAALLHDVGKADVPLRVLDHDGPLSADDWALMQRHVELGVDVLLGSEATRPYVSACLCSHERWRGQGYPRGLAGEAIPFEARLVAVCDSLEAMTAPERRYVLAVDRLTALTEIFAATGDLFAPDVLDPFLLALGGLAYPLPSR